MKNINIHLCTMLILIFGLCIGSCKKESENSDVSINGRIRSAANTLQYSGVNFYDSSYFSYDSYGRLVEKKIYINPAKLIEKITFGYSSNSVLQNNYDSTSSIPYSTKTLNLNPQGYLSDTDNSGLFTSTYDPEGYLLRSTQISNGDTTTYTYTYENGNLILDSTFLNSAFLSSEAIEYFTDKTDYQDNGLKFYGTQSKNLRKSTTYPPTGDAGSYMYTFDIKGRVKRKIFTRTIMVSGIVSTVTSNFTYFD